MVRWLGLGESGAVRWGPVRSDAVNSQTADSVGSLADIVRFTNLPGMTKYITGLTGSSNDITGGTGTVEDIK